MPILHPADAHPYFVKAFNAADRRALLAYYADDAKLVLGLGNEHVGSEAIAAALEGFLALAGTMRMETAYVINHGPDLALARGNWRLDGTGSDGAPVVMEGSSVELFRRQADGTWRCAVDAPFGAV